VAGANPGPLPNDLLTSLISLAIQIHERQLKEREQQSKYLPLVTALIAGLFTLAATLLPNLIGRR
jgi:hypothetical protein